mgnify:CR=1 FL=1
MEQRPIVVVDGMNLFVRHFAVNESVTTSGEPCGGVVGFIKALYGLTCQFAPAKVYVVWEQGGGCPRRKKLFPEYKANRTKVKSDFKAVHLSPGEKPTKKWIMDDTENKLRQVKTLVDALKHLPVCQLYVAETECDDVIGFLIRNKLKSENAMKIIVSSDRDFYQLLDEPNVKLYNPADKSFHDGPIVKVKVGKDEYVEIPARNYALVRTLTGDDSDNIPGVPGLGFKTTLKLFPSLLEPGEDHTIDKLLEVANGHLKADKKPLKAYSSVSQCEAIIRRNWQLMYLSTSTLAYNQITKIEGAVDNFQPKIDKLGVIKFLLGAGIVSALNFDAIAYQLQLCLLRP